MKPCDAFEKKLSAYIEGAVSDEDRKILDEHLKTCGRCKEVVADLRKSQALLQSLERVEPPPWFTQKTMARIRGEAPLRKGLLHSLFHPFYIKAPIEALALCFVAVLAFQVYRATVPEMKLLETPHQVAPGAPEAGARKDEQKVPPAPSRESRPLKKTGITTPAPAIPGGPASAMDAMKKDEAAVPVSRPESQTRAGAAQKMALPAEEGERQGETRMKVALSQPRTEAAPAPQALPQPAPAPKRAEKAFPSGTARNRLAAPDSMVFAEKPRVANDRAESRQLTFQLVPKNSETALKDAEIVLARFAAEKIRKESQAGKDVLTGEMPGQKVKELIEALKTIGEVRGKTIPSSAGQEAILFRLEVDHPSPDNDPWKPRQ